MAESTSGFIVNSITCKAITENPNCVTLNPLVLNKQITNRNIHTAKAAEGGRLVKIPCILVEEAVLQSVGPGPFQERLPGLIMMAELKSL